MTPTLPHPAAYGDAVLDKIADAIDLHTTPLRRPLRVLDPFAGIGRIHRLPDLLDFPIDTTGVEIEPEWAHAHRRTMSGDATRLSASWSGFFDVVATSPCYGNRMADSHEARDACSACGGDGKEPGYDAPLGHPDSMRCRKCKGSTLSPRRTYRHLLGRPLTEGSAGGMQWGDEYRDLHERAWAEARRVLRPQGILVLNIKDHVRDHQRVRVAAWHRRTIEALGFTREATYSVAAQGFRHGENHDARAGHELVYVFRKP